MIRYTIIGMCIYFGVNWVADNPLKVKYIRKQMNETVDAAIDKSSELMEGATK